MWVGGGSIAKERVEITHEHLAVLQEELEHGVANVVRLVSLLVEVTNAWDLLSVLLNMDSFIDQLLRLDQFAPLP